MDLKFYLNKVLKADNIENYTLKTLMKLRESYENFLDSSDGTDPDFPLINFGRKGKKIKGKNIYSLVDESEIDNGNSLIKNSILNKKNSGNISSI